MKEYHFIKPGRTGAEIGAQYVSPPQFPESASWPYKCYPKPLLPVQRTGLRDHGSVEDFRARQYARMQRAGWPLPKEKKCA